VTVGDNDMPTWFNRFVETMRAGEKSLVILELLQHDRNEMKVLEKTHFYQLHLKSFVTVICRIQTMTF
jgi:hypothetical protein